MNFIWPENLLDLDEAQLVGLVQDIEVRRERVKLSISNAKKLTATLTVGAVRILLEKELTKFTKSYDKAEKALEDVEKRLSNITALRLQMDDANGS